MTLKTGRLLFESHYWLRLLTDNTINDVKCAIRRSYDVYGQLKAVKIIKKVFKSTHQHPCLLEIARNDSHNIKNRKKEII